jgi:hypothetical protein
MRRGALVFAVTFLGAAALALLGRAPRRVFERERDGRLETAVVAYTRADVTVTVIGTVHVGTPDYYAALARETAGCEAVLVEGIAGLASNTDVHERYASLARGKNLVTQSEALRLEGARSADLTLDEWRAAREAGADFAAVEARNRRCLAVLDAQSAKRIAIVYGVGHLPGLHRGLIERGFEAAETRWHTAF